MTFVSTNHHSAEVAFQTALFAGIAPDGGLYMPTSFPQFSQHELATMKDKTLPQIGALVLHKWIPEIAEEDIHDIANKALTFPLPLHRVGSTAILELFHGPTMAFKDIAANVLAQLFAYYLQQEQKELTILVATSGDTGGAIAQAFSGIEQVKVVILYPKGRVSALQEEQLTRVRENVFPLVLDGDFDACQAIVKQAFLDPALHHLNLSSANSINIGRLIPQIIYYVWTYAQLQKENIQFVVPSGNMGNVCAGLFAMKMGLPFSSFIVATNENDAVLKYYETGKFEKQPTKQTLSTAMDIGNPSNFVRILSLFDNDHEAFCKYLQVKSISDAETIKTIKQVYNEEHYVLDFHTAVGYTAAKQVAHDALQQVILSTASPVKFATEIQHATGIRIDDSHEIAVLQQTAKRSFAVDASYEKVEAKLMALLS